MSQTRKIPETHKREAVSWIGRRMSGEKKVIHLTVVLVPALKVALSGPSRHRWAFISSSVEWTQQALLYLIHECL